MPERDGYIPGVPCWIDTNQPDPDAAAQFYGGLFGWELENVMPPESGSKYFIGRIRGSDVAAISSVPEVAPPVAMWNTYVWVESADETAAKVTEAGGNALAEPFDVADAGRMAVFSDPEGAVFCVWQAGQHKGARLVNEAGSLNFNGLHTRDVEGAKTFYGAVFGWRTLDMGGGQQMWTMPGYGDYLEDLSPGTRARVAELGGTPGFEEVVASIAEIPADQPDTAPHWDVTFAVEDADAIAAKAMELGGRVVVAPIDVPWARMAVIADPEGATFNATQFVPENKDLMQRAAASAG
jgi:predicted enzyme related to lactoylglutathione lyase